MGRNTWDSLPIKPLANRVNIVLSSKLLPDNCGAIRAANLDDALNIYRDKERRKNHAQYKTKKKRLKY
jgi:dihydrofolate reductase